MKNIDEMSKDEKSLLLYLESRAVDHGGLVSSPQMNDEDRAIAKRWNEEGFLKYSRIPSYLLNTAHGMSNCVELTDEAWETAAALRRARAEKSQHKAVQPSIEHFQAVATHGRLY